MYTRPQWINWTGNKVPLAPVNDPSRWASYETVRAIDPDHIGFVLTADDPYFCIDLDHAYTEGQWSPVAQAVCAMFPGAYVEISQSGTGLHIIGQGTVPEGYGGEIQPLKPSAIYTHGRYIAITGRNAQGNPDAAFDLTAFAVTYLKPTGSAVELPPAPGPAAIPDDATLIAKMLGSRTSAATAFGGKASVVDLWNANEQALADSWPSVDPAKPYDASAADAALAGHLAFWTGRDCERMVRLMRMSKLVRPKWDRDDYLPRTVTGAAARCERVYTGGATVVPFPTNTTGPALFDIEAQATLFAGCTYVIGLHRVLMPNGMLLKPEQFRGAIGGGEFFIDPAGGKPTKNAFEAFTENRITRWPRADTMCFRPELASGAIVEEGGLTLVNSYVPAPVVLGDGDVTPFLDLLNKLLPNDHDRAIMVAYLAALRQYPGVKFRWCPLIQGVEGNGKGALMAAAEYAVGERYTHKPNAKELGDSGAKFTGWLDRKLLILIEEIYVSDRREVLDALKPLITDDRVEIQHKGVDQVTAENRANFILTSNHKDAVLKTRDDRRYAIFYTAQQCRADLERYGMTGDYMPNLWRWLRQGGFANVAGYLQRYTIPDALNPARDCHRAPETSSTADAIRESRGLVEQEILQACEEGRPGFAGGWISSVRLAQLLHDLRRTVAPRKRGALMSSIGYVPHPVLPNGQCNQPIMQEEQKRPTLYVLEGSIQARNLTEGGEVLRAYMKAQGYAEVSGIRQG